MYCVFVPALLLGAAAAGCNADQRPAPGKPGIFVSIPPQAYFAERIGGEHVRVNILVGPGQSPHSYEPTPRQMADMAHARIFFSIGVPFEKSLIPKIEKSYKNLKVVNTGEAGHAPGHDEEHHSGMDPHTWLDPKTARDMARTICKTFKQLKPERAEAFDGNLALLLRDLDLADGSIRKKLAPFAGRKFYVFHPAFGHFARAYGLEQVAVEKHGKEPGARQLAALIEEARKDRARVVFVQPQFARSSVEAVASAIGARVEPMDPLAKDYLKNLEDMAGKLHEALSRLEVLPPDDLRDKPPKGRNGK